MLHLDILDDLSEELVVEDYYQLLMVNDLVYELSFGIVRRIEYYYRIYRAVRIHETRCGFGKCKCERARTVTQYVCLLGDLDALKWFYYNKRDRVCPSDVIFACMRGHLEIVEWFHNNLEIDGSFEDECTALDFACANGYLDIAKWLYERGYDECTDFSINYAIQYGHVDIVIWLIQNYLDDICIEYTIWDSVAKGLFKVVEWIHYVVGIKDPKVALQYARMYERDDIADFICRKYDVLKIDT